MKQHDLSALSATFDELANTHVDRIPGVWVAHSGKPGPVVGITIMTHGNEPCGLGVYQYFRQQCWLERRLRKGSVYVVLNNLEAARQYFEIAKAGGDMDTKLGKRFIKVNMNRLPADVYSLEDDERSEVRRAQELRPIWDRFDHALDIHSMAQAGAPPMIVALGRSDLEMVLDFPIQKIITRIDAVQRGKPATYFYGKGKVPVYGIEAGSHEEERSFTLARICAILFLQSLGIIDREIPSRPVSHTEYRIFGSVWFPDESYELTREIPNFGDVKRGEVLATGNGDPIIAQQDEVALMGPRGTKPPSIGEEVLFLAHEVEHPVRK
jgi:predicted deacylase